MVVAAAAGRVVVSWVNCAEAHEAHYEQAAVSIKGNGSTTRSFQKSNDETEKSSGEFTTHCKERANTSALLDSSTASGEYGVSAPRPGYVQGFELSG